MESAAVTEGEDAPVGRARRAAEQELAVDEAAMADVALDGCAQALDGRVQALDGRVQALVTQREEEGKRLTRKVKRLAKSLSRRSQVAERDVSPNEDADDEW
jgi:uncharacterized protein YicC (UPF0701 family)